MTRFARLAPGLLILAAIFAVAPLHAQVALADEGAFRVFLHGVEVGTEEFVVRQAGTGTGAEVVATGTVRLRLPDGTLELDPRLRAVGLDAAPTAYQVEVRGTSPTRIVGTIGDGRFSAKIVTPTGEALREYVASSGAVVLDEGVAHHYYFLAQRLHNGRVPILVPRENRQVVAEVVSRGEETVTIAGRPVRLFHLVVQPRGGQEQHVWVDALNRVLQVEIPARGYRAVRTQIPR